MCNILLHIQFKKQVKFELFLELFLNLLNKQIKKSPCIFSYTGLSFVFGGKIPPNFNLNYSVEKLPHKEQKPIIGYFCGFVVMIAGMP